MFLSLLSHRAIQAGFVFSFSIVASSLFYSCSVKREVNEEDLQAKRAIEQLKSAKKVESPSQNDVTETYSLETFQESPLASDTVSEKDSIQTPIEPSSNESSSDSDSEILESDVFFTSPETQRVSPLGFGPYPEIPSDYSGFVFWDKSDEEIQDAIRVHGENKCRNYELMSRVLIELWNQGDRNVHGAFMKNGKVYPNYYDVAYVRYSTYEALDGTTQRYISEITSPPNINITEEEALSGNLPSGVRVVEMGQGGIDPYRFLELNQK